MIKTVKLLFLPLLFTVVGCSSVMTNEIAIFNDIYFQKTKGELFCEANSIYSELYSSHLKGSKIQIPLFKCMEARNYSMFLGIPFNTNMAELVTERTATPKTEVGVFQTDTLSYFFQSYEKENVYYSEFSQLLDKNYIYILTVSNSKSTSDSLFTKKALSGRFIRK